MRTALIVIGALVLLTVLIGMSRGVVVLRYWDGALQWSVRYLGIRLLPRKKRGKPKKKKEKKQPEEPAEERPDFLMDKIWKKLMELISKADMAASALYALPGPLVKLLRAVRWYDIETDFVIGGDDAAKTAELYGRIQMLLHPLLGYASQLMTVRPKKIAMVCDYTEDTSKWNFGCRISAPVGTVVIVGIWFLLGYFKDGRTVRKNLVSDKI